MRYTTYSKYTGSILDALNIQDLLERLADFLLQSGFEGGPHYHPWWGWSGDEGEEQIAGRAQGGAAAGADRERPAHAGDARRAAWRRRR